MMKRLPWICLAVMLGAWTWRPVTWGANTLTVNGRQGVMLNTDGGFNDGGALTDGGVFLEIDGGVCADGGLSCQACSGTCNIDGGPQYTVPVDGGWVAGSPQNLTSDPFPENYVMDVQCQAIGTVPGSAFPPDTNASFSVVLIGTADQSPNNDGGVWAAYDGGSNGDYFGCIAKDGGTCQVDWTHSFFNGLWPYSAVQTLAGGGDGGFLWCQYSVQ